MDAETTKTYPLLIASLGFLTILLLMFIISVIRNYRNRLAEYQLDVIREIELIDAERKRIAADLHDEIGTGLSAIGLMLQQAFDQTSDIKLLKANDHLKKQQQKLREISFDLMPHTLETQGLWMAIEALAEELREASGTVIVVRGQASNVILNNKQAVHVYRIVRELLTNIVKHAAATKIAITTTTTKTGFSIDISNNGKRFTQANAKKANGMGLQNIRSRIEVLGALLSMEHLNDGSTRFTLSVPSNNRTDNGK